jgi:hypothetical protein
MESGDGIQTAARAREETVDREKATARRHVDAAVETDKDKDEAQTLRQALSYFSIAVSGWPFSASNRAKSRAGFVVLALPDTACNCFGISMNICPAR